MRWVTRVLGRRRLERQLDAELRDHLDRLVADHRRAGLSESEARRQAILAFGGLDQAKESCRDVRGTRWLDDVAQDLRYALRLLRLQPGFAAVAVLSLALGIGANTAIFSLVNAVLLRSLPVKAPDRLVMLEGDSWTNPIWEEIRAREASIFAAAFAYADVDFDLARSGPAEPVRGLWVSGRFFEGLGVAAAHGRLITTADDRRTGGPDGPVAVISHSFWQRRFGGARDVLGRTLTLDRVPFTIVGVTAAGFSGVNVGRQVDVMVPLGTEALVRGTASLLDGRSTWWLDIMARLKPDQTIDDATRALRAVQPGIREATMPPDWRAEHKASFLREGLVLVPAAGGKSMLRQLYRRPLLTLLAVVGLVLVIACANIANLMLARAHTRRHELAMRLALGASRGRVARQLLAESLVLAAIGGAVGLVVAQWGAALLVGQIVLSGRPVLVDVPLDWRVLAFTGGVALATAVLFAIAPAFTTRRLDPHETLKEQGHGMMGEGRRALSGPLVVAQVALSLVLLVLAGLFLRTFTTLARLDPGFDDDAVLVVDLHLRDTEMTPAARRALYERVRAASLVPGVTHAALSAITPVGDMGWNDVFDVTGSSATPDMQEATAWVNAITPGWFATYGTAIRRGRDVDARDRPGTPPVALVNEAFARARFGDADPVGRTIQVRPHRDGPTPPPITIVGVVENAAYRSIKRGDEPIVYLPLDQMSDEEMLPHASLSVRAAQGSPAALVRALAAAIARVDRSLAPTFTPLSDRLARSLAQERLLSMLSGAFGLLSLLLASIGLYGVTAYRVTRRRSEIGLRMALGADAGRVTRLVLARVAVLVGTGLAVGFVASLWLTRYVSALLYGLEPGDPATLAGAVLLMSVVGAVAGWVPARRATRIDAARVLREG